MEQFWGIYFPIIIAVVELLGPGYWGIRLVFFKPSFSATRWVLRTLNFTSAPSDLCWDEQQKEYESFIHESTHLKDASVNLWRDIFLGVFFSFSLVNKSDVVLLQRPLRNSNGVCCFHFKDPDCLNPRQIKTKNLDEPIWTMELGKVGRLLLWMENWLSWVAFFHFSKACESFLHITGGKNIQSGTDEEFQARQGGKKGLCATNWPGLNSPYVLCLECVNVKPHQGHSRSLDGRCEEQEILMFLSSCFRGKKSVKKREKQALIKGGAAI